MIALRIFRWITGYVRFSVEKGSPERFLNQCARCGISIWDIYNKDGYGACVQAGSYRKLLPCAHKAGTVLRVRERKGLPFRSMAVRRREGLIYGAGVFLFLLFLLSTRYWSISIAGNAAIPPEKIETALVELGVTPGIWKARVEPQVLQQQLMGAFPEARWLSVNTSGCTLTIQLEESVKKPAVDDGKQPCNMKASVAGQVVYMEVYDGTPEVQKGDAVIQGQLLINAVVEDTFGGTTLKHAAGKVIAATERTFTAEVELSRATAIPTGRKIVRRSADLFGLRVPLTISSAPSEGWRLDAVRHRLQLCGVLMPVSLYVEEWTQEEQGVEQIPHDEALRLAKEQVAIQQKEAMKSGKVLSSSESEKEENGKLIYTVTARCEEDIAVENELFVKP